MTLAYLPTNTIVWSYSSHCTEGIIESIIIESNVSETSNNSYYSILKGNKNYKLIQHNIFQVNFIIIFF